jgi:protein AATF/BFR2
MELEEEYARLQAQDKSASAAAVTRTRDAAKAHAVQNQARIWEQALGIRIALQKALTSADRLPGAAAKCSATTEVAELEELYERAQHMCSASIVELLVAIDALLGRQEAQEGSLGERQACKRGRSDGSSLEALWEDIQITSARLAPLRDASVDRWQRKTLLATGRAALRSEMRAFNQSLSHQVAAMLRDPSRALDRMQRRPEAAATVLCEGDGDVSSCRSGPGTFDDTAFYQVLLQEFLESTDAGSALEAAVQVLSAF